MTNTTDLPTRTSTRGFASMDPEKQRAIARKGGESVPHEKRSFSQNPALAAQAGRKGGQSVSPAKRSFSQNFQPAWEPAARVATLARRSQAGQDRALSLSIRAEKPRGG